MVKIVISSGHGKYVRGAAGIIDEVDEARKMVEQIAAELKLRGADVVTFHDDTSKDQNTNLNTIVAFHNKQTRDLDVSVHFNAFEQREQPVGAEVWYVSQKDMAAKVSAAIASVGFIDRGAKYTNGLYFLNKTNEPALLLEICFVDSEADCEIYAEHFSDIADAIADLVDKTESVPEPLPPHEVGPLPVVDIRVDGEVMIYVNGEQVGTKG
jgi:N-acetylmuramoyl-L-alanine amidase